MWHQRSIADGLYGVWLDGNLTAIGHVHGAWLPHTFLPPYLMGRFRDHFEFAFAFAVPGLVQAAAAVDCTVSCREKPDMPASMIKVRRQD